MLRWTRRELMKRASLAGAGLFAANRGWAEAATKQLGAAGVW